MTREEMRRVHELAKEMEGDYVARLALAFRSLGKEVAPTLEGTEKQVAYATAIREKALKTLAEEMELLEILEKGLVEEKDYFDGMFLNLNEVVEANLKVTKALLETNNAGSIINGFKNLEAGSYNTAILKMAGYDANGEKVWEIMETLTEAIKEAREIVAYKAGL